MAGLALPRMHERMGPLGRRCCWACSGVLAPPVVRVCPPQIAVLHLELLEPPILVGRQPGLGAGIDLGQLDPPTQRVAVDAQLLSEPSARASDGQLQARIDKQILDQTDQPVTKLEPGTFFAAGMAPPLSWDQRLNQTWGGSCARVRRQA
jgi:hypothetical protein